MDVAMGAAKMTVTVGDRLMTAWSGAIDAMQRRPYGALFTILLFVIFDLVVAFGIRP